MRQQIPSLAFLAIATRRDDEVKEASRKGRESANALARPGRQPVKEQLSRHLLEIKLHRLRFAPSATPGHKRKVICFKVQESSAGAPKDSGGGTALRKLVRDAKPGHDAVPLPAVDMHGTTKKACGQREVEVKRVKKREDGGVFKPSVLTARKALSLGVANVNISNRVRRQSVSREDQVLPEERDHL